MSEVKKVTKNRINQIIQNSEREEYGLFYTEVGNLCRFATDRLFVAVDNLTGNAYTEEFATEEDAMEWLQNQEETAEDIRVKSAEKRGVKWFMEYGDLFEIKPEKGRK